MELIVLAGLQASGKSAFFRERFADTHEHVSKDLFRHNRRKSRRQEALIRTALSEGRPVVVDNTNPAPEDRAPLVGLGREYGAKVVCYFFEADVRECLRRNAGREGRERVPDVAIFATAKRLVPPSPEEGFDGIFRVRLGDSGFEVGAVYPRVREGREPRETEQREEPTMASTGQEVLKDHYGDDHLSHEQIESLGLRVVTENGEVVPDEEVRGKVFRIVDPDEPSGYLVRSTETTGQQTTLCYLQPAS